MATKGPWRPNRGLEVLQAVTVNMTFQHKTPEVEHSSCDLFINLFSVSALVSIYPWHEKHLNASLAYTKPKPSSSTPVT